MLHAAVRRLGLVDTIIATDAKLPSADTGAEVSKGVVQKLPVQICGLSLHMGLMVTPADIGNNLVDNVRQECFARAQQSQPLEAMVVTICTDQATSDDYLF